MSQEEKNARKVVKILEIIRKNPGLDAIALKGKGWSPTHHGSLRDLQADGAIIFKNGGWHLARKDVSKVDEGLANMAKVDEGMGEMLTKPIGKPGPGKAPMSQLPIPVPCPAWAADFTLEDAAECLAFQMYSGDGLAEILLGLGDQTDKLDKHWSKLIPAHQAILVDSHDSTRWLQ